MSVEILKFKTVHNSQIEIRFVHDELEVENDTGDDTIFFWLDRSQAHLLMLYLQEHLK